jgi:hypothetical protein
MATSIEGSAGNDLVIPDSAADDIVVDATEDLATFEVQSKVSDINLEVGGEKPVKVEGAAVKNSVVRPAAAAGETAKITFETKSVAKTTIVSQGEGSVEVDIAEGKFKKSTIDLSNSAAKDSISFGGDTTVTKSTIILGDGKDTVTFSEGIKLKGDTKIQVGDGKDVIEVPEEVKGKGQIGISNFGMKDKLFVGGEKLKGKKIYNGKKDLPDFVTIQFEDGTVV